jgi:threonine/homoserine/homoserine lactone efflux protein
MLAGGPLVTAAPVLGTAVRMLLAGYLAYLAWRLRRVGVPAAARNDAPVARKDVFLTALLNPKAFVFALAIFPPPDGAAAFGVHAAVFALTVATVATGWIVVGAGLRRNLPLARFQPAGFQSGGRRGLSMPAMSQSASAMQEKSAPP